MLGGGRKKLSLHDVIYLLLDTGTWSKSWSKNCPNATSIAVNWLSSILVAPVATLVTNRAEVKSSPFNAFLGRTKPAKNKTD